MRLLSSEGRATDLRQSALSYEPATRGLTLPTIGLGLHASRQDHQAQLVADIVTESPLLNGGDLRSLLHRRGVTGTAEKTEAIKDAEARGWIKTKPLKGRGSPVVHAPPGFDWEGSSVAGMISR